MAQSKVMTAEEAVRQFVADGDIVYAGYHAIAYNICHEIVRQKKKNLDVVGASHSAQAAFMFIEGCADRTRTGYIGGALAGGGQLVRELMDRGELLFEDYSNQSMTLMFMAGALGIPYIPTRSFLGTDYLDEKCYNHPHGFLGEKKYKLAEDPFTGSKVVLLPALKPDVAFFATQRADEQGNVQVWGTYGDSKWALWAAKKVIVSVEEVVPTEVIRRDPNRTIIPSFRVSAIVHDPFGAHPGYMPGHYDADHSFAELQAAAFSSRERYKEFVEEWIYGAKDRKDYVEHYVRRFGYERLRKLTATPPVSPIGTISYAYTNNA